MSLEHLMSSNLLSIDMDDDLEKARQIFNEHGIHHLVVTEKKKLVGVLTVSDLYKHLSPNIGTRKETPADILLLHQKAHQIMSRNLITATPDMGIYDAILKFHDHKVSCLPIVDDNGNAVGILTWRDILAILASQHRQRLRKNQSIESNKH